MPPLLLFPVQLPSIIFITFSRICTLDKGLVWVMRSVHLIEDWFGSSNPHQVFELFLLHLLLLFLFSGIFVLVIHGLTNLKIPYHSFLLLILCETHVCWANIIDFFSSNGIPSISPFDFLHYNVWGPSHIPLYFVSVLLNNVC